MAKIIHDLSLIDIAPPSIAKDENVKAVATAFDKELWSVSKSIQDAYVISRIKLLPERVIDLLAWQWHVDFYEPDLDVDTKRELVLNSIKYHRKKGTKYAIKSALEALGFVPTIKEWYEADMNTAPHTFSVTGYYKDDEINVDFLGENTEEILTRIVEITKPVRSSMIYLLVAPVPMDLSEHVCRWDVCNWEHFTPKIYDWGLLNPDSPLFDNDSVVKRVFDRDLFTIHDTAFWDVNTWNGVPVRLLRVGSCSENAILASLEWGEGEQTLLYPNLWDYSQWDYASTFSRMFGSISERIFDLNFELEGREQPLCGISEYKFIYDTNLTRARWNQQTWEEFSNPWADDLEQNISGGFSTEDIFSASLDSGLYTKWTQTGAATWSSANDSWQNMQQNNFSCIIKTEEDF